MSFEYSFEDIDVSLEYDESDVSVSGSLSYDYEEGWHGSWDEPPHGEEIIDVNVFEISSITTDIGQLIVSTVEPDVIKQIKADVAQHFLDDQDTLLGDLASEYEAAEIARHDL
jgi:hypothetical protein